MSNTFSTASESEVLAEENVNTSEEDEDFETEQPGKKEEMQSKLDSQQKHPRENR